MPAIRNTHRRRAQFERRMAARSATDMARIIHRRLAVLHQLEAGSALSPPGPQGEER